METSYGVADLIKSSLEGLLFRSPRQMAGSLRPRQLQDLILSGSADVLELSRPVQAGERLTPANTLA